MKLPFGKKSSTPQKSTAQKSTAQKPKKQKRGSAGVPPSAIAQPRRQGNHWENGWVHPPADPGLPGICGYLNGVKQGEEGHHPSRFVYVRPDGQPDAERVSGEPVPSVPSSRRVPKGFFGS